MEAKRLSPRIIPCFRSRKTSANAPNSAGLTNLKYAIKTNGIACGTLRSAILKYSTTNALPLSLDRVINSRMWVAFRPKRDGRIECQISKEENWNPKNRKYWIIHIEISDWDVIFKLRNRYAYLLILSMISCLICSSFPIFISV